MKVGRRTLGVLTVGLAIIAPSQASAQLTDPLGDSGRCVFESGASGCVGSSDNPWAADLASLSAAHIEGDPSTSADDAVSIVTELDADTYETGGQASFHDGDLLDWYINSDGNATTGATGYGGAEWMVRLLGVGNAAQADTLRMSRHESGVSFGAWTDLAAPVYAPGATVGRVAITIPLSRLGIARGATFNVNALSNYTCPTTAPPCASPSKVYYDEMPEGLVAPGLTVTVPPATPAPGVSTPTATGVTRISAQVSGTITPNGLRTTYYFEYTDTPSSDTWKRTSSVTIAAASGTVPVSASLNGLSPGRAYTFRLVAQSNFDRQARRSVSATSAVATTPAPIGGALTGNWATCGRACLSFVRGSQPGFRGGRLKVFGIQRGAGLAPVVAELYVCRSRRPRCIPVRSLVTSSSTVVLTPHIQRIRLVGGDLIGVWLHRDGAANSLMLTIDSRIRRTRCVLPLSLTTVPLARLQPGRQGCRRD